MADEKSPINRERDRELLIPVANTTDDAAGTPKPSCSTPSSSHLAGREVLSRFFPFYDFLCT